MGRMKMLSLIKCPPYCRVNCATKHHPLLVVLLNCGDTDDKGIMKQRLHDLKHVVMRYEKSGKWKKDDNIPDAVEHYRFPMIHWACALGRAAAVEWLTQHGLDPATKTVHDEQEETGLHRAIMCLQETCPNSASDKFEQLLPALQDAMFTVDGMGNLPIHTCCDYLANEKPVQEFYQGCVTAMISHLKKQDNSLLNKLLESENSEGNTPLHILCRNDRCFSAVTEMIQAGASIESKNHKGQTPLDVALEKGQVKLVRYLYDEINPKAAPFVSSSTDVADKARTQHNKRTPKVATRKVYDSKGMVIGEEVKVMLKNQCQKGKRSINSDSESVSGDTSPNKRARSTISRSLSRSQSPDSNQESPVPSQVDHDEPPQQIEDSNDDDSDSDSDSDELVPARILHTLPTIAQTQKINDMSEQEFLHFLYQAGPHLQGQVLAKLQTEQKSCNNQLQFLESMHTELQAKQEDVHTRQRAVVLQIQELLAKLTKVQREESKMVAEVQNIEWDLCRTVETEGSIRERLNHCNEALTVLCTKEMVSPDENCK